MVEADVLTNLGYELGTVFVNANGGALLRAGIHLPRDFRTPVISDNAKFAETFDSLPKDTWASRVSCYCFAGAEGRVVGHNLFLDGGTFRSGHDVDREPLVGDLIGGLSVGLGQLRITYTYMIRGPEFEERDQSHRIGTCQLSYGNLN